MVRQARLLPDRIIRSDRGGGEALDGHHHQHQQQLPRLWVLRLDAVPRRRWDDLSSAKEWLKTNRRFCWQPTVSFVHKRLGGHVGVGRGTKANSAPPRGPGYTIQQRGGCQRGGGVTVIVKLHTTYGGARPTRYLSTYRVCEHRGEEGAIRSRRLPSKT